MNISVKEIVCEAAQVLGLSEWVNSYLNGEESAVGQRDTEILIECFNRVQNEVALDYLPLIESELLRTETGKIPYSSLIKPAIRILQVKNEKGELAAFKLYPDFLETEKGKLEVYYTYSPAEQTIEGVCEYGAEVPKRLFVYGMAAEYSLIAGELEAAGVWDKKYKDAINAVYKLPPAKKLRSRRWV